MSASLMNPVARAALLDMVRRKDLAVAGLFLLALLVFLAAARASGIENPATGTFLLNMGMDLVAMVAQVLTLVLAARQFPEEMENRTLYPLLARPVRRAEVLVGKWLACAMAGISFYGVMTWAVWLLAPRMEFYDGGTCLQAVFLQGFAVATVAAWAMAVSLGLPKGPAILVSAFLVFGAGPLARLVDGDWLGRWVPDLAKLNLTLRYTDGIGPLPAGDLACLVLGAVIWIVLGLVAGIYLFNRKNL